MKLGVFMLWTEMREAALSPFSSDGMTELPQDGSTEAEGDGEHASKEAPLSAAPATLASAGRTRQPSYPDLDVTPGFDVTPAIPPVASVPSLVVPSLSSGSGQAGSGQAGTSRPSRASVPPPLLGFGPASRRSAPGRSASPSQSRASRGSAKPASSAGTRSKRRRSTLVEEIAS